MSISWLRFLFQRPPYMWVSKQHKITSALFSHSVMSDSLWPHGLQHVRIPCPSATSWACSNSCPSRQWHHPTISSSVVPFSSCPRSIPAIEFFQMSQHFASGSQIVGVSPSASVLHMNIQDWFPLGLTGWVSWQSKGLSRVFSNTTVQKHQLFRAQVSLWSNSHTHTIVLTRWRVVGKVRFLLFNMLPRLAITFLPKCKCLLISWLQSLSTVILKPKKTKSVTVHFFPIYLPWNDGTGCHDLSFLNVEF